MSIESPILFILKKDDSLRLYINYCTLNKLIVKNYYPLLLISKTLNYLAKAIVYTKLDLYNIYYKIKIYKKNI